MSAWTPEKSAAFREAFYDFLSHVRINSKELGGNTVLGDHIYRAQRIFLDAVFDALSEDIHDVYVLKSRQLGLSTISRALSLFWLGMHDGLQGAMVFDTAKNTANAKFEITTVLRKLPDSLKFPRIESSNRDGLILENGSQLQFMQAGVKDSKSAGGLGRSSGLNFSHSSELCSWVNAEGIKSFRQSLSETYPDRLYIWESPLALDTPIATPSGWTTMGKIEEGNEVFTPSGARCRVVGVSPVFINRKCYRITFSNGDQIVSDADHKWEVQERRWATNPQWKTKMVKTADLDTANHKIELPRSIELPDENLPIDPYLLGAWLGDGKSDQAAITTGDSDIAEMRAILESKGLVVGPTSKNNWRVGRFTVLGHRSKFSRMNLFGNKHIPSVYLRASENQRRELLAGLMDTDGHVSKENRRCEYCSIYPRLVDDVAELLASLGIRFSRSVLSEEGAVRMFPSGNEYACRRSERLRFSEDPSKKVFNLKRKADVHGVSRAVYQPRKTKFLQIVSVEPVDSVPVRCIEVDSPSHLFLAGRYMIPTHNTARGFNEWYKMWDEAEKDRDHKKTVFLGWWAKDNQIIEQGSADFSRYGTEPPNKVESARIDTVFEEYGWEVTQEQLAWYRKKIDPNQENDEDDEEDSHLTQEQPWCAEDAFQQTGSNFFQADKLTEATRSASSEAKPKTYKFWPGFDFVTCDMTSARTMREVEFRVWEEPATEACYVVAADPAFGRDERNNNSAAQVLRCYADGVDQVAEYASSTIMPHQFAWLLWTIIGYYGSSMPGCTVMFITEINGPGEEVWRQFQSTENIVRNGYLRQAARDRGIADIFNNARKYIYGRSDSMSSGSNFQFKTNGQNKVQLMEACRNFFHNGLLSVRSIDALDEMRTITRDGDSIGAEGSNRDDRTFALALGIRAWDERVRRAMVAGNRTKKAELAKINMSIEDQWNIFRASQLSSFFKEKATARLQHTQAIARQGWRNGGRQPPTGRRW